MNYYTFLENNVKNNESDYIARVQENEFNILLAQEKQLIKAQKQDSK